MTEILLSIQPEDVPPLARGRVAVDFLNDPENATKEIRSVIYPGWERLENRDPLPELIQPYYRVLCDTPRQAMLADMLKPNNAKVDIVLPEEPKPITHPLVRFLKSRIGTAATVTSTGFSSLSYMCALGMSQWGNKDLVMPLAYLGTAFVAATITSVSYRSGYIRFPWIRGNGITT